MGIRNRDTVRDEIVLSLRQRGYTLQEIADRFDISRERVRQIAARMGYRHQYGVELRCPYCGLTRHVRPSEAKQRRQPGLCVACYRARAQDGSAATPTVTGSGNARP